MVTVYSTEGCHLCEQAKQLCSQLGIAYRSIDIAYDDNLFNAYGTRIPVIKNAHGSELGWPFSATQLQEFINE